MMEELPRVEVHTRAELRAWLSRHHQTARGAWIITLKKSAGGTLRWDDLVEEALCVGWVDSVPRKVDARRTMILLTPRKPTSRWSAKNKAHVEALERRGLMKRRGKEVVAEARRNGNWNALDAVSRLEVPADLERALAALPPAPANWASFPPSTRRGILEWITSAKTSPTRERRVSETARLAQRNVRANQWPRAGR